VALPFFFGAGEPTVVSLSFSVPVMTKYEIISIEDEAMVMTFKPRVMKICRVDEAAKGLLALNFGNLIAKRQVAGIPCQENIIE
jgi:hypothetical protein